MFWIYECSMYKCNEMLTCVVVVVVVFVCMTLVESMHVGLSLERQIILNRIDFCYVKRLLFTQM